MDKYDFISSKIKEKFSEKDWFGAEQKLRRKCMKVFALWLNYVKNIKKYDDLSEEEIKDLVKEWVSNQKRESEYIKKYKEEGGSYDVDCETCVFKIELGDDIFYCLQYVKEIVDRNCQNEVEYKASEYYGELFEFLNLLKVLNV